MFQKTYIEINMDNLKNLLKKYDVFVDFGNADKFLLKDFEINEDKKTIIFKGSQGNMNWVKIDALHPINIK